MDPRDDVRVHAVARQGGLLLTRVERPQDRARPGVTAIALQVVNQGDQTVVVEAVDFHSEALSVTLPIRQSLDPGETVVAVGPGTADAVTFQASRQGRSAHFTAGAAFLLTLTVTTPQGEVTFILPLSWGFWIEGGYGFTLPGLP